MYCRCSWRGPTLARGRAGQAPGSGRPTRNLAHLARHHQIFLDRVRRILEEDEPELDRYRAEADPEWPRWSALATEEVLSQLRSLRAELVALVDSLSEKDLARGGVHPHLGRMSLPIWIEFFLLHEAHHLYTVLTRVREK